ncbi:hypothetical protein MPTK2_2g11740 [Marchantia polymorpha subsp. ruderalis]
MELHKFREILHSCYTSISRQAGGFVLKMVGIRLQQSGRCQHPNHGSTIEGNKSPIT